MKPVINLEFKGYEQNVYTLLMAYMYKTLYAKKSDSNSIYYREFNIILNQMNSLSYMIKNIKILRSEGRLSADPWDDITRLGNLLTFHEKFERFMNKYFPEYKDIILEGPEDYAIRKDLCEVGILFEFKKN